MFRIAVQSCFLLAGLIAFSLIATAAPEDSLFRKNILLQQTELTARTVDGHLTVEEIMRLPQLFQETNTNGFNLKTGTQPQWIKLTLTNTDTIARTAIIELVNPFLYRVNFYTVDSSRVVDSITAGSSLPYFERLIKHPNFQYKVVIAARHTLQCYASVAPGTHTGDLTLLVWDENTRSEYQLTETRLLSYFFIINVVFLLLIGLAITQTRQKYHWYYFIYALFGFLFIYADLGLGFRSIWPHRPNFQNASLFILGNIYQVFGLLFVSRFFRIRRYMRPLHISLQALVYAGIAFGITELFCMLLLPLLPHWLVYANTILFLLSGIIVFIIAIGALRFKSTRNDALWTIIGFAPHALSILFLCSRPLGWFNNSHEQWFANIAPLYLYTSHAPNLLFWSVLWEVIIVFYLILKQVKIMYEENSQMMHELSVQRENSMRTLLSGIDNERKRLAQELHDGTGVGLSALKMKLKILKENAPKTQGDAVSGLMADVDRIYEDIRSISHNLMPKTLSKLGLYPAIDELVNQFRIAAPHIKFNYFRKAQANNFNEPAVINIYRIVQELLTNVVKHAQAKEVSFQLIMYDDTLMISVEDDGAGFDMKQNQKGMGLEGIQSRVNLLHGQFSMDSAPGNGTFISVSLPLSALR